ncbi:MAG: hypothetical protein IPI01_19990 [Ignavibacteriae bacterium]|nr:hypothetical protein [Ignavibacteriota bacterium]
MKRLTFICLVTVLSFSASAQITIPRVPDAYTMALWHCDESNPEWIFDVSGTGGTGIATGTTVVAGRFGRARLFNGSSDYITVGNSWNHSLDFSYVESFTVECWFKTSSPAPMVLIRKGLAPQPGYTLIVSAGRVVGIIGNRADGTPPDTLLTITSDSTYNDGAWHHAMLIRDRPMQQLYLYVDGEQAAAPVTDTFGQSIANDRPLTIGRWESDVYPYFFDGVIDEVRITRDARHPHVVAPLMALWNFDGPMGMFIPDSSANHNGGIATGTTVRDGISGAGRAFNGNGDHIVAGDPENGSLDFDSSQSFTVEAWFKTTSSAVMQLLRKGYARHPGYGLSMSGGYADAVIGNNEDGAHASTLTILHSTRTFNDGLWHRMSLIRDRVARTVSLYVDGQLACIPRTDTYPYPLANDRPLTIGMWDYPSFPYYFQGSIDRVAITRGALHPAGTPAPGLLVRTEPIDCGTVLIGDSVSRTLTLYNSGSLDTLVVSTLTALPSVLLRMHRTWRSPRESASVVIHYTPAAARAGFRLDHLHDQRSGNTGGVDQHSRAGVPVGAVTLLGPLNYTSFSKDTVLFTWCKAAPAPTKYWFEWSTSSEFTERTMDSTLTDTLTRRAGFPEELEHLLAGARRNQNG